MKLLDCYRESVLEQDTLCDFSVKKVEEGLYVGVSKENNIAVISESVGNNKERVLQKTAQLIIKCNVMVALNEDGKVSSKRVNVLMCKANDLKQTETFLKLCSSFIKPKISVNELLEVFGILNDFFKNSKTPTVNEIQGLYAELFTMYYFENQFDLVKYWQVKDKLKFDFSINDKTKIEIKSTTQPMRIHHFTHDQLAKELYDIYIISYKLQMDGQGLKLKDLVNKLYSKLSLYPQKLLRVEKVIMNLDDVQLECAAYNETYTVENLRIIKAENIPTVNIPTQNQDSISAVEYNALLTDSNKYEVEDEFINIIKFKIKE